MIEVKEKYECCGCEACVQACPKQCISFEEDAEGFRYPLVDKSACIDCGLCERVCPVLNQAEARKPLSVFAAKNRNEKELLESSSGGVFVLLAKAVLKEGGVVFGARFDKDWNVVHSYAETEYEAKAFMGSKYVQSRIGNSYAEAKGFLTAGRKVLFTGTSCQIAGLKRYLRKDYDNLLTADVICHGVPSPKVWRMYLKEIKKNARQGENSVSSPITRHVSERDTRTNGDAKVTGISFRDKQLGWKKFSFALTLAEASADGKKNTVSFSHIHREDPFMKLFLKNVILRPSCNHCPAKSGRSMSDITIADFWGIEKVLPEFDDHRGVGLVLVHSEKGQDMIHRLNMDIMAADYQAALAGNSSYATPVRPHQNRQKFFRLLDRTDSISRLSVRIFRPPLKTRIYRVLKKLWR